MTVSSRFGCHVCFECQTLCAFETSIIDIFTPNALLKGEFSNLFFHFLKCAFYAVHRLPIRFLGDIRNTKAKLTQGVYYGQAGHFGT